MHAQVTAQMNFAKTEETSEQYSPNQQTENAAIRSRQISSSQQQHDFLANGVPGALSNQPVAPLRLSLMLKMRLRQKIARKPRKKSMVINVLMKQQTLKLIAMYATPSTKSANCNAYRSR